MPLYRTYARFFRSFVTFPWNNETKTEFARIRQNWHMISQLLFVQLQDIYITNNKRAFAKHCAFSLCVAYFSNIISIGGIVLSPERECLQM